MVRVNCLASETQHNDPNWSPAGKPREHRVAHNMLLEFVISSFITVFCLLVNKEN